MDEKLICKQIGYEFKNTSLLREALTHSSYANENNSKDNERLEFLGDSVLDMIVGEWLYKKYPDLKEGILSKMRASLVCEQGLEVVAREIRLGELITLGRGEAQMGGNRRPSIVSDAFEALIAAIYLDSDFETVKKWVLALMKDKLESVGDDKYFGDYKTNLQEIVQGQGKGRIHYKVMEEHGEDHMKEFVIAVFINGKEMGRGSGLSKKEAEQKAAYAAIRKFDNDAL